MKNFIRIILSALITLIFVLTTVAQDLSGYKFENVNELKNTPVKSQDRTGTCWSFATTSFIESEIIRMGHEPLDLSEMYFVRHAYETKANNYVKLHGSANFGQGGQAHDVTNVVAKYGFVPEDIYPGKNYTSGNHDHTEISNILEGYLDGLLKGRILSPVWMEGYKAVLDVYFGKDPVSFDYKGKKYTPVDFAKAMGFKSKDYVELTSYTDAPYYSAYILKIPDNWTFESYYDITLEDLMKVIDNALDNGYTVCWDGDVSEKAFSHKAGVAVVPDESFTGDEDQKITIPVKEKVITAQTRQESFESFQTTDDHLMHMVGTAIGPDGKKFYLTKNSWGSESNEMGGKLYMSTPYVELHTIAIMVHKNSIPAEIKKKLGL